VATYLQEQSFEPELLQSGKTMAFFLSFLNYGGYSMYCTSTTSSNSNQKTFDVYVSNEHLQVLVGVGKRFGFANTYKNYVWNGAVVYSVGSGKAALPNVNLGNVDAEDGEDVLTVASSSSSSSGVVGWSRTKSSMMMSSAMLSCVVWWMATHFVW